MIKRLILLFLITLLGLGAVSAQDGGVSIGKGRQAAHEKAILELVSDSKGLLIPRLTSADREAMFTDQDQSAMGLMVFDIDENAFFYYTGTVWNQIGSAAAPAVNIIELGVTLPNAEGRIKGELFFITTSDQLAVFDGSDWVLMGNTVVQDLQSVLAKGNDAGGLQIVNLGAPLNDGDAATKKYVDDKLLTAGAGDMLKTIYDANANGKVDVAETADNAENANTVNNLTVETAVPLGAVFTDEQNAAQVGVTAVGNLSATDVQSALEELQGDIDADAGGDMLTSIYDTNANGKVDVAETADNAENANTVNNLTVETAVPLGAVFTDSQNAADVAYDNSASGLAAADVKAAIDELADKSVQADWDQTDADAPDYIKHKPDLGSGMANVYHGTLSTFGAGISLLDINTLVVGPKKNGALFISDISGAGYYSLAIPAAWRKPALKFDGQDTFMVFCLSKNLLIDDVEYSLWQSDIELPAGFLVEVY